MNKKKASPAEVNAFPSCMDSLTEHPFFQWITKNGSTIALGLLLIASLLFFVYRTSANKNYQAEADYFNAENDYQIFSGQNERPATPAAREEALHDLQTILARRPELKTKYDALIAQSLLIQGKADESQKFMAEVFKRTAQDQLPLYTSFAKISLLIGQADYTAALEQSKALDQQMNSETSTYGDALRAYNLLRIAMLEQQLNHPKEELEAWKNFKAYALDNGNETNNTRQTASFMLQNIFAEGNATLINYIEARETKLSVQSPQPL